MVYSHYHIIFLCAPLKFKDKLTPLMVACTIGEALAEKAAQLLLAHGASPNGCVQVCHDSNTI